MLYKVRSVALPYILVKQTLPQKVVNIINSLENRQYKYNQFLGSESPQKNILAYAGKGGGEN